MKKIILFGSSGLIGSSLKKHLEMQHDVIGVDKNKSKNSNFIFDSSNFNFSKKDLSDYK